ncbi:MAG: single-stranded DNA-binding protein [Clostridia bacterium]|nr:single-stranded DNA-binding protein [Clostridia bacterium]
MASLNKAILMGNLVADPELKQTPSGVSVCSFRIGVQRRFKDANGQYASDFINIVAWRQQAEFVSKYFRKGSSVVVVGSIQTRDYTDQQGNKRYATEVVADEVSFGASKNDSSNAAPAFAGAGDFGNASAFGQGAPVSAPAAQPAAPKFEEIDGDEDLPF